LDDQNDNVDVPSFVLALSSGHEVGIAHHHVQVEGHEQVISQLKKVQNLLLEWHVIALKNTGCQEK